MSAQHCEPVLDPPRTSLELPEKPAESVTPKTIGPLRAMSAVEKEPLATESQSVRACLPSP